MVKFSRIIRYSLPLPLFVRVQKAYHFCFSFFVALWYGFPSNHLIVIGVTGTKGKSTTCILIKKILEEAGYKVGMSSGILFNDGQCEWLNDKKMTMPGRGYIQKLLRAMVKNKCGYVVIETTSEGIKQFRHAFINYDTVVFTNLYPEHIESHGSFENYRLAKEKLFMQLTSKKRKQLNKETIHKYILVNRDDAFALYFSRYRADGKYAFGIHPPATNLEKGIKFVRAQQPRCTPEGISFIVGGKQLALRLLGEVNIYNALAALTVAYVYKIRLDIIQRAFSKVTVIPGRLEFISEKQDFDVIVDYAHDPESFRQLYRIVKSIRPHARVIHVFGATGGGRDKGKRPEMGRIAAQNARILILTNDDPYDDDPEEIINDIKKGIHNTCEVFTIIDRRAAIINALTLAQKNDMILITGKGSEQRIILKSGAHRWDDREVVKGELNKLLYKG